MLASHWSELSHVTLLATQEAGKCSLSRGTLYQALGDQETTNGYGISFGGDEVF